jgi:succinate dehydrogenase / fumarate reductase cytochrome b subunit
MLTLKKALSLSVGKKFLMALSGLALVVFIILHLAGNILLYFPGGELFNAYAAKLKSFGIWFYVGEVVLFALILFHVLMAISLRIRNKSARPVKYATKFQSKKGNSRANLSSLNMVVTGVLLLLFIIVHVKEFRFGPDISDGFSTTIQGETVRDLYKLVVHEFKETEEVVIYTIVMIVLFLHLRHGFWSAFQSLGAMNPRLSKPITVLGYLIAFVTMVGFIGIPIYIYFFV